jgi:hypothetical protein
MVTGHTLQEQVSSLQTGAVRQGVEGQPIRNPGWMRIKT